MTKLVIVTATFLLTCALTAYCAEEAVLAKNNEALMPVVIAENAPGETVQAAEKLAQYLERISGAEFVVEAGDGSSGIVLGTATDFAGIPFDFAFDTGPFSRDEYLIRSTPDGLYLLGATPAAAELAAWDLLYQFGYRYFFLTDTWEVVPEIDTLKVIEDRHEKPDFYVRRGPRGAPRMHSQPWAQEGWRRWQVRNRTRSSFNLSTGHVYQSIIRNNREVFEENPEFLALVDGERGGGRGDKFCISNEELRAFIVENAVERMMSDPEADSISMDPSDGHSWCECEPCHEMGSVSDRVVILANEVAEAINGLDLEGERYVGIYAYNAYSPPPNVDVHPNVIVSLATTHILGGYTFDEMLEGWGGRTNMMGLRDYYSISVWRGFLPHGGRVTRLSYLGDELPEYHSKGARFMNASSDNAWGSSGLHYYLSSRILWDVSEGERIDELVDDFLDKSFWPASEPMRDFFELTDADARDRYLPQRRQPLNDDMMHRMYRYLADARELAEGREDVLARIDDMILYTRFVDLYRVMADTRDEARQQTFDDLVSFTWRIRKRVVAPSVNMLNDCLHRFYVSRDDNLSWPEGGGRSSPADIHREREDEPFSNEEIEKFLERGMATHDLLELDFIPSDYEIPDMVPAGLPPVSEEERAGPYRPFSTGNRGNLHLYLWTDDGQLPRFWFSAGYVRTNRGPLRWELFDSEGVSIKSGEVPPKRPPHGTDEWYGDEGTEMVDLQAPERGLYRFVISNTHQGYYWDYEPRGAKLSMRADPEEPLSSTWLNRHYFYVPAGQEKIVVAGTLRAGRHSWHPGPNEGALDPEHIRVEQGFTVIPVPEGRDGSVWMLRAQRIRPGLKFVNIPGFLAYCPSELLLPRETAEEIGN